MTHHSSTPGPTSTSTVSAEPRKWRVVDGEHASRLVKDALAPEIRSFLATVGDEGVSVVAGSGDQCIAEKGTCFWYVELLVVTKYTQGTMRERWHSFHVNADSGDIYHVDIVSGERTPLRSWRDSLASESDSGADGTGKPK